MTKPQPTKNQLIQQKRSNLEQALGSRILTIEKMLPAYMKKDPAICERVISVALFTFASGGPKLQGCSVASIVRCVLDAAAVGFILDNRMAYAIPYKEEAQCQFDWKALVALARRSGLVKDVRPQVVHEHDTYESWETDGQQHFKFVRARGDRGKMELVYVVVDRPDGSHRHMEMDRAEVYKVRGCSKAWQYDPKATPWHTFEEQMWCKVVTRRVLKFYQDDPDLMKALSVDDEAYTFDVAPTSKRVDGISQASSPQDLLSSWKGPAKISPQQPDPAPAKKTMEEKADESVAEEKAKEEETPKNDYAGLIAKCNTLEEVNEVWDVIKVHEKDEVMIDALGTICACREQDIRDAAEEQRTA